MLPENRRWELAHPHSLRRRLAVANPTEKFRRTFPAAGRIARSDAANCRVVGAGALYELMPLSGGRCGPQRIPDTIVPVEVRSNCSRQRARIEQRIFFNLLNSGTERLDDRLLSEYRVPMLARIALGRSRTRGPPNLGLQLARGLDEQAR